MKNFKVLESVISSSKLELLSELDCINLNGGQNQGPWYTLLEDPYTGTYISVNDRGEFKKVVYMFYYKQQTHSLPTPQ